MEKFILLEIANQYVALPIRHVLRIVDYCPKSNQQFSTMGLAQVGRYTIELLDLHQQLNLKPSPLEQPSFLVVMQNSPGEVYAIPADAPPDLIDIPLKAIQPLQASSQPFHSSKVISHVAVISQNGADLPVFLMNMKHLLK